MAGRYSMEEYADKLCEGVARYNSLPPLGYPKVTYNFGNERKLLWQKLANALTGRDFDGNVTYEYDSDREICHSHMTDVENHIRNQLNQISQDSLDLMRKDAKKTSESVLRLVEEMAEVVDGLSNVLYWGHANANYQWKRVEKFREGVSPAQIFQLVKTSNSLRDISLVGIRRIKLPQFRGVSFISKTMMFLCPSEYAVLDLNIARFARSEGFSPLEDLSFNTKDPSEATAIPLEFKRRNYQPTEELNDQGKRNEECYENWVAWCKGIAYLVNSESSSSHQDLRAVDVERGLFQFVGSKGDRIPHCLRKDYHSVARRLLECPTGWTSDEVIALGRKLRTNH